MIGTKEKPGLMTLLTKSLYEKIDLNEFQVNLSYLVCLCVGRPESRVQEVYNEVIRDLLNPTSGMLELLEDDKGNICVPGLSSVRAPNINRVRVAGLLVSVTPLGAYLFPIKA